jgi:hypothetical protein
MHRLLILACSATKRPDAGLLPARERYNGPLWQTLRTVDADGRLASCFALSARYGLVGAEQLLPDYDSLMTLPRAQQLQANPILRAWNAADRPREALELGDRWPAATKLRHAVEARGRAFDEVCVVGGHLYLPVGEAIARDLQILGLAAPWAARPTIINGEIGRMRQQLRAWLLAPVASKEAA